MRKPIGSSALLMIAGLWAAFGALAISSCDPCDGSLDPIECTDLCEQDPPHEECEKCREIPRDELCPQCRGETPMFGCPQFDAGNVGDASTDASADSGESGAGAASGTSGGAGGINAMSGGSGGAGGMNPMSGGAGGSGGMTGGSPSVSCDTSDNCPPAMPVCGTDHECGGCTMTAQCGDHDNTPLCDTRTNSGTRGQCVECTSDTVCMGTSRPQCVEGACEECETDGHCMDVDKPECSSDHVCVACTDNDACDQRDPRDTCNVDGPAGTRGRCVECESHSDCPITAPQCDSTGACVACTGTSDNNAACMNRSATPMCNTRAGVETSGQCVECTGDTESACSPYSCKQSTGECTGTEINEVPLCGACEADSECESTAKCVSQTVGAFTGTFCFEDDTSGCAGVNPFARPYSESTTVASVDGAAATYCLPRTTCLAISDTVTGKTCMQSAACGTTDITDGVCSESDVCTYVCAHDYECPPNFDCTLSFCVP